MKMTATYAALSGIKMKKAVVSILYDWCVI